VQALMLSLLVGLLVEVTATDPTGFDGGPESASITVIMKFVPVPTGVLAVSGLIVVAVVRAVTVKLADAVLPVPPLVEVTAAVVLLFRPVEVPFKISLLSGINFLNGIASISRRTNPIWNAPG
jgi:hypothetical protein